MSISPTFFARVFCRYFGAKNYKAETFCFVISFQICNLLAPKFRTKNTLMKLITYVGLPLRSMRIAVFEFGGLLGRPDLQDTPMYKLWNRFWLPKCKIDYIGFYNLFWNKKIIWDFYIGFLGHIFLLGFYEMHIDQWPVCRPVIPKVCSADQ